MAALQKQRLAGIALVHKEAAKEFAPLHYRPSAALPYSTDSRKKHSKLDVKCQSAAPIAAPAVPSPALLPPAANYLKIASLGAAKAELSIGKTTILSLLAGVYISLGGLAMLSVGGATPGLASTNPGLQKLVLGLFGLPTGLLLVLLCGAELFTGNTCYLTAAWWEKRASFGQIFKNWSISFTGNLIGSLFVIKLLALTGLTVAGPAAMKIAAVKTGLTFTEAFTRGILANWMVCLAVWQANAADSLPGKVLAAILPISAFVAMGFEHSVANMFLIPFGIACGAEFSFTHFLTSNLIPVTLGNIVGGALCCATPYALVFGRKSAQ